MRPRCPPRSPAVRRPRVARRRAAFSLIELLVVVASWRSCSASSSRTCAEMRELDRRAVSQQPAGRARGPEPVPAANSGDYPLSAIDPRRPGHYVAFTGAAAVPPAGRRDDAVRPGRHPPRRRRPVDDQPAPSARGSGAASPVPATGPAAGTTRPASGPAVAAVPPRATARRRTARSPTTSPPASGCSPARVRGPGAFVCPSGDESADPMAANGVPGRAARRSNFTSREHLSYSYAYPLGLRGGTGSRLNSDLLPADFAILADKNPGTAGGRTGGRAVRRADRTAAASATAGTTAGPGRTCCTRPARCGSRRRRTAGTRPRPTRRRRRPGQHVHRVRPDARRRRHGPGRPRRPRRPRPGRRPGVGVRQLLGAGGGE